MNNISFKIVLILFIVQAICYVRSYSTFEKTFVTKLKNDKYEKINLGNELSELKGNTLLILGTYAADFNTIEYLQRLQYYMPKLNEKGIKNYLMILNASPEAVKNLTSILEISKEIMLYSDTTGSAGKVFGCNTGWKSNDSEMNPYLKLFGMLFGLGAWATLPSVIGGYIGP